MIKLRLTFFQDKVDPLLDTFLNQALDSGIKDVRDAGKYYIHVRFKDGSEIYAWNRNRYYAWLKEGWFMQPVSNEKYKWGDARPHLTTMARLLKHLSNHRYVA